MVEAIENIKERKELRYMSEEEKEAIEYWSYIRDTQIYDGYKGQVYAVVLLNLIEKQQKDIGNWKKYSNEQDDTITLNNNKICDLEFKVEKQQKELEKKDRIIAMAMELISRHIGTRTEICKNMNCNKEIEKECKICALEYFTKKADETNG